MRRATKIERRQRIRNILLNIFLFITIASLIFVIMFKSDFFRINNIQVIGNIELNEEDIIKHSQISIGENIFRLSKKDVEKNLKKLSYIKDVEIKRNLPANILINISEREEKALIKSISTYQIIDIEGYILKQTDVSDDNLPIILGLNIYDVSIGDNLFNTIDDEYLIDFFKEGDRLDLLRRIESVDLEYRNNINILLKDGIDIAFGKLDNVEYRLRLLDEILRDIEEKEINVEKILMNRGEHPVIITEDLGG